MKTLSSCVVYTPKPVADAMVAALKPRVTDRVLEPCIGNGSLVQALVRQGIPARMIRALDLDEATRSSDRYASVLRGIDFLEWSTNTSERFLKIVANPPYFALNRLPKSLRKSALRVVDPFTRAHLRLRGNYWYAFLCASVSLLEQNGSLCFLLPASWDYSNYARQCREALPDHFEQVYVHRCRRPLFNDVQEGSVILVARGFWRPNRTVARLEHATVNDLVSELAKPFGPTIETVVKERVAVPHGTQLTRLGELVDIHIGAVTGDAGYFLLTQDQRRVLKLPSAACVPVLTRSSHLRSATISRRNWRSLRDAGERVWLFRPSRKQRQHHAVQRYLRLKPENGGCARKRFKVQNRSPWHRTVLPHRVDGFLSGMASAGPWISLSAMDRLSATNTLYVVTFRNARTRAGRAAVGLSLLTTVARNAMSAVGRRYADGLLKYEPGDLKDVKVPVVTRLKGVVHRYRKAVARLLDGDVVEAQRLADEWIQGSI